MKRMIHPDLPGAETHAATPRSQRVLETHGWVPADAADDTDAAGDTDEGDVSLDDLTRPELDEAAKERGLDPRDFRTKADLVEALSATD